MTPRLDRDKPFGQIIPSGGYYQDGHYFNAQAEYLHSAGVEPAPKPQAAKPKATVEAADIDLAAWAKGEAKHAHFKVVQAMLAAYPDDDFGKSRATIVDFLVGKGVITEDEAQR